MTPPASETAASTRRRIGAGDAVIDCGERGRGDAAVLLPADG